MSTRAVSATDAIRERRNAGAIEDAIASVGATITVCEHLLDALAVSEALPADYPYTAIMLALGGLREACNEVERAAGV